MLTNVVITTKGADDDVADSSTGTNKGNPTVSAIFAMQASCPGHRAGTLKGLILERWPQGTVQGILTLVGCSA